MYNECNNITPDPSPGFISCTAAVEYLIHKKCDCKVVFPYIVEFLTKCGCIDDVKSAAEGYIQKCKELQPQPLPPTGNECTEAVSTLLRLDCPCEALKPIVRRYFNACGDRCDLEIALISTDHLKKCCDEINKQTEEIRIKDSQVKQTDRKVRVEIPVIDDKHKLIRFIFNERIKWLYSCVPPANEEKPQVEIPEKVSPCSELAQQIIEQCMPSCEALAPLVQYYLTLCQKCDLGVAQAAIGYVARCNIVDISPEFDYFVYTKRLEWRPEADALTEPKECTQLKLDALDYFAKCGKKIAIWRLSMPPLITWKIAIAHCWINRK